MGKKINLDELFDNNFNCYYGYDTKDEETAITKSKFKQIVHEFAKQLLELASENAEYETEGYFDEYLRIWVNKKSILDTITQVE